jgi:glutathione S-transferase
MSTDSPVKLVEDYPTIADISLLALRLHRLLDDPHPGLMTWLEARREASVALRDALNKVL